MGSRFKVHQPHSSGALLSRCVYTYLYDISVFSVQYDQQLKSLGDKDAIKRKTLSEMVKEVSNIFPPDLRDKPNLRQTLMEDLLNKDGTTENIRTDCELRMKSLQEKECVVLVSGMIRRVQ